MSKRTVAKTILRQYRGISMACLVVTAVGLTAGCQPGTPTSGPSGTKPKSGSNTVNVFVPCGMVDPMTKVRKKWEVLPGKPTMKIQNDNAVILMRRIRRGEKPDVLLSPGETEMSLMTKEGYISPQDVRTFGTFRLILVTPKENKAGIQSVADLTSPKVKSIAIADPAQNSVGYYAEEALKSLKLWDSLQPKLISHWHALEAVEYVCKGRVDVGIYFDSCPFESTPGELQGYENTYKIIGKLPESSYPPVKVQAGVLKQAPNPEMGQKLLKFLLEPDIQKLLSHSGIPNASGKAATANP